MQQIAANIRGVRRNSLRPGKFSRFNRECRPAKKQAHRRIYSGCEHRRGSSSAALRAQDPGMYVLCLFSQGSSEPEPVWCTGLKFRFCRQSCAWRPRPKLAQLGGGGPCQPAWQMTPSRRKRSKLPPVDQPDWCSVGDHQSPVCRLTPYRISRLKMQNRQTGRSARPSAIETPTQYDPAATAKVGSYIYGMDDDYLINRFGACFSKADISTANTVQENLLPQFRVPAPTARERRSG